MRRRPPLYPLALGTFPGLYLAAHNPGAFTLTDLAAVLLALLVGTAAVYLLLRLALFRAPVELVALAVIGVIAVFRAYRPLHVRVAPWLGEVPAHIALLSALLLVGGIALAWIARRANRLQWLTRYLGVFTWIFTGWLLLLVVVHEVQSRRTLRESRFLHAVTDSLPAPVSAPRAPVRDIYLIILDEHANSAVLRERFGFDNQAFEDSLRQLGFVVPRMLRSNYLHTMLSLPSMLNFTHVVDLAREERGQGYDSTVPNELVQENRVTRFLKARGYRVFYFPSQWWPSTKHLRMADVQLDVWPGVTLGRELSSSDLRRKLRLSSALSTFRLGGPPEDADFVLRTFLALAEMPDSVSPKFVMAHILSPHTPYALDQDCRAIELESPLKEWRRAKAGEHPYVRQVRCVDRLVLALARSLIARSRVAPIILFQGDHGSNTLPEDDPGYVRERSGTFGAYYLPGAEALVPDTITLVNLFPLVFNHYFGTALPRLSDALYASPLMQPYALREVSPRALERPVPALSRASGP